MTLPTFSPGIDGSAVGASTLYSQGAAAGSSGGARGMIVPAGQPTGKFDEAGYPGILTFGGYIQAASQRELLWPTVFPLYNRLRRGDPEMSVVRQIFSAVAGSLKLAFVADESDTSDDHKKAVEFGNQVLDDLDGGIGSWRDTLVAYVPFMGWGWWETVPGLRRKRWVPPDKDGTPDEWRSRYDDGLVGFRRLAFRDHSSFHSWDIDVPTGRLMGMRQLAFPHPFRVLPLKQSVHITFGDTANPEGLTPLEAIWRLERIQYGLQVVQGIGFEHSAGYLNVTKTQMGDVTDADKTIIREAARSLLAAQESNYALWPFGFTGKVEDIPFAAGTMLSDAIRYYGLLKLALYNAQWVGMSSLTDRGSYSALHDASSTWMVFFNAMMEGFATQLDSQFGARLFDDYNPGRFPAMTKRPKLVISKVEKFIELEKLAPFIVSLVQLGIPLGPDDYIAFRKKSGFLPEVNPEPDEVMPAPAAAAAPGTPGQPPNGKVPQPADRQAPVVAPDAQGSVGQNQDEAENEMDDVELVAAFYTDRQETKVMRMSIPRGTDVRLALVHLQDSYSSVAASYRNVIYDNVLMYLVQSEAASTKFKSAIGQAVLTDMPDVFYAAYKAGGGEDVDPEDDQWLTARMNAELGHVNEMFVNLKSIKAEQLPPNEMVTEATSRADGYASTLEAIRVEGLLRGAGNKMLTWKLGMAKEHCGTCVNLNGQRHSAKWFVARNYIAGKPGCDLECGGWQCQCSMIDSDNVVWVGG